MDVSFSKIEDPNKSVDKIKMFEESSNRSVSGSTAKISSRLKQR